MITNLKKLSDTLDKAAGTSLTSQELVAYIKENRSWIEKAIKEKGICKIQVKGCYFNVLPSAND